MINEQPDVAEWMAWVEEEKLRRGAGNHTWIRGYTMRSLIDDPSLCASIRRRYYARHHDPAQPPLWKETP